MKRTAGRWRARAVGPTIGLLAILWLEAVPSSSLHPREFHRRLRDRYAAGKNTAEQVEVWRESHGDASFDTFLIVNERRRVSLQRLLQALKMKDVGLSRKAGKLLQQVAQELHQLGADSEAAFSLYYAADLAQEESNLALSLDLLDQASALLDPDHPQPYLEAVLLQGKGYALWYLDQLLPSIQAFYEGLKRFQHLGLSEGIAATWNNLAALHEELQLPEEARRDYLQALALDTSEFSPQVDFQLNANYAFFLARHGPRSSLQPFLEKARTLSEQAPFEFALLECRVASEPSCSPLRSLHPSNPSERIERLLVLGQTGTQSVLKEERFRQAIRLSREVDSPYLARRATLELGRFLEDSRRFTEAAELYRKSWESERDQFESQAVYYPFGRAVAPLFEGRVRSLVKSGRPEAAWQEIQLFSKRRQARLQTLKAVQEQAGPTVHQAFEAVSQGGPPPPSVLMENGAISSRPSPKGYSVLELWSDGPELFAWIFAEKSWTFRSCKMSTSVSQWIGTTLGPYYRAVRLLPEETSLDPLKHIYEDCFSGLEPWFEKQVLVIPHNEIQSLPLELLHDGTAFLGDRIAFSYLPLWSDPHLSPVLPGSPLLLSSGPMASPDHAWLSPLFPDLEVTRNLPAQGQTRLAPWIFLSTHFNLSGENWLASRLGESQFLPLQQLLHADFRCNLLTLGMCDGGNSQAGANPYWLGLAEVLLKQRADSLLLSRWKLDEFSMEIYREAFALLAEGQPLDLALFEARLQFRKRSLIRGGHVQSAAHPFFWAGISFVGRPNFRFSDPRMTTSRGGTGMLSAGLPLLLLLVWMFRKRHQSKGNASKAPG